MKPLIDAGRVQELLRDSLFRDEEVTGGQTPPDAIVVQGVVRAFAFHPGRLASHDVEVGKMLAGLPVQFREDSGGGWSFLNAPIDRNGAQWGEQIDAEALMCLGIGLKRVALQLPRELWSALPGGVPYFVVRTVKP